MQLDTILGDPSFRKKLERVIWESIQLEENNEAELEESIDANITAGYIIAFLRDYGKDPNQLELKF